MHDNQIITTKNDLNPFHFHIADSLYNGATYKSINGTTALYLDGRSYAETPALPIQTTSFSILCWMKVLNLPAHVINIYSDWSSPHQFRFGMIQDSLCANLRRDFPKSSNIVYFCRGWASYNTLISSYFYKKDESAFSVSCPFSCSGFFFSKFWSRAVRK